MQSINKKLEEFYSGNKRIIAFLGLGVLIFHFLFILAYTLPQSMVPQKMRIVSQRYVAPAFHQQWNLFAPDVESYDFRFLTRYYDGHWTQWEEPTEIDGIEIHSFKDKIIRAIGAELNGAANSFDLGVYYIDSVAYFDKVEQSYFYYQAMRYAHRYYRWNGVNNMDSIQVKIDYYLSPALGSDDAIKEESLIFNPVNVDGIR